MIENLFFRAWLANTVHAISGIWAYDWRGSQRKWPLTTAEIRVLEASSDFTKHRVLH